MLFDVAVCETMENYKGCLSNSPCKEATMWQEIQKGANFCTTLLLFYHTSDWLNQQNLPKLQVEWSDCEALDVKPGP